MQTVAQCPMRAQHASLSSETKSCKVIGLEGESDCGDVGPSEDLSKDIDGCQVVIDDLPSNEDLV